MFERFTDRARRVVVLAQEEARMLNHDYIGTEHLLLGLVHESEGVAARALVSLGLSLGRLRREVEEVIGQGRSAPTGDIPFTPRAKKVLELSLREALELGHNYIGTEHLLLGLLRVGEGVGAQVLRKLGADLDRVRQAVIELLAGYAGGAEPAEPGQAPSVQPGPVPAGGPEERSEPGRLMDLIRSAVRRELSREHRPEEVADPERAPLCPRCRASLEETVAYRVLDVPSDQGGEARAVAFSFCRRCGTWLGPVG